MPLVDSDGSNEEAMVRASFVLFEREFRDVVVVKKIPTRGKLAMFGLRRNGGGPLIDKQPNKNLRT